jgi:hypothetical protein
MKTSFEKFMASSAVQSVELGEHKIDLALIDEIDKLFDGAIAKKRTLQQQALKIATELENLQPMFIQSLSLAKKASAAAKELGANDLIKLYEVRAQDAKDWSEMVGQASDRIRIAINEI